MFDFWEESWSGLRILGSIIGVLLIIGVGVAVMTELGCRRPLALITAAEYDAKEVRIFCYRIDASLEDFIASPGIRKQYELFREGKSSDFIETASAKKKEKDARSQGMATGIAVGTSVGMSIR